MYKEGQLVSVEGGKPYRITHIFDGGELFKVEIPHSHFPMTKQHKVCQDSSSEQTTPIYSPDALLYGSTI